MGDRPLYDTIGLGYADVRVADPRIADQIRHAIGDAASVVNVGAGTGNYEPSDRRCVAAEPSMAMIEQRRSTNPVVRAVAEALPFADRSFDVAAALFTLHHWQDRNTGLREMQRVSDRQVLVGLHDETMGVSFWLRDYFPVRSREWLLGAVTPAAVGTTLDIREVRPLLVPADCSDGFTAAYWNRPERYLDPAVQAGMSSLARLDGAVLEAGTRRLRTALESGEWDRRHGALRELTEHDVGYRIVIAGR